jgi:hypothetical protein
MTSIVQSATSHTLCYQMTEAKRDTANAIASYVKGERQRKWHLMLHQISCLPIIYCIMDAARHLDGHFHDFR